MLASCARNTRPAPPEPFSASIVRCTVSCPSANFLSLFQSARIPKHECDDACAGYHKQKVRHGSHLLPVKFRGGMVSSLPLYIGKISDLFIQSQTTSFVNPLSVSIPYFAAIGQLQLVDISKIDLNSKIKKFSHSFICGKGYSPPLRGENSFLSTAC